MDSESCEQLLNALQTLCKGDFSFRMSEGSVSSPNDVYTDIMYAFNELALKNNQLSLELERVSRVIGVEGKVWHRASMEGEASWEKCIRSVNSLISNMWRPTFELSHAVEALTRGELTQGTISEGYSGEYINATRSVGYLASVIKQVKGEVNHVARNVKEDGNLRSKVDTVGYGGIWKDLALDVNSIVSVLEEEVFSIRDVTTAVANGDLTKKIISNDKGDLLEMNACVNVMVDKLYSLARELTHVAREVGMEGRLGGQAQVKTPEGAWKEMTDSVNAMAANLTGQVATCFLYKIRVNMSFN